MARDPKEDPYYNPKYSDEINEVTNTFVYEKKVGKQATGDAIIVRPKGDSFEVLLIERSRGPHQGGLALPGGFKEGADKVEDFVAREALEETGLKNTDIKQTIDLPTKMDRFDWDVRFADGVDVSGKIFIVNENFVPKAGDDAVSAKFVPIEDIASGKVDIAFLHSEWLHDTAVELNSPSASALQEIVDKDRTRNINLMKDINKKRLEDKQPLMNIEKANDNAEEFAKNYYGKSYTDDGFKDPNKDFDAYMLETTDEDIAQWYFEKTGNDWISDTKTMSQDKVNRLLNDFKTDVAQDMVANFDDELALSARQWLNENTTRGIDPTAQMDDTLKSLELSNTDMFPEEVLPDTPTNNIKGTKGTKILKALDWLDPVEKAIAGMISSIGLPTAAQAYVTAEAINWFGNLTFEAAKSKGQADLLQSQILMGKASQEDIKKFTETVMSNMKSGVEKAEKISPSANVYNWIGKMLDRWVK